MKRNFTANIFFLIGINVLVKPFYALGIDTSVQNIVGPEAYGMFIAIFNFVYIQQVFADLGVQNFNNRDIARNPEKLQSILPKVLGSKVLFTVFFIFLTILTAGLFGYLQYFYSILIWVIASQASLSMLLYLRTNVSGTGRYYVDSLFSVLDKLILIIWMSWVIWGNPEAYNLDITYFAKAQFFSIAIATGFILFYTHKRLSKISVIFDLKFTRSLLIESLPYATLVILMAGYSRIDGIMLEKLLDDNARTAGEYARSFRLYDTFNNFTFLFAVLLLPMFSKMIKLNEKVDDLVKWAFRLISLISVFSIIMVYFEGGNIMKFFFKDYQEGFATTLFLLMIAGLGLGLNYIYGTLLTANGSIKRLNQIAIGGFILNIILNVLVIPRYGQYGAAFTTAVTQMTILLIQMMFCYRYFELESIYIPLFQIIITGLFAMVIFYLLTHWSPTHFLINIVLTGILYLGLSFGIGLLKVSDFKRI